MLRIDTENQAVEPKSALVNKSWKGYEKIAFRIAFFFVGIYSIPWDVGFYERLIRLDYSKITYRDFNSVFNFYNPQFVNHFSESGFFGLYSYANVLLVLVISLIGAGIWTVLDKKSTEYNVLYYWIRVLARYRVAYGVIAWGYKKTFIMQMPFPNVGLLHTDFIDFFAKRLYWESIGIAPYYEVFLGFAEVIPGFLLLFRKTIPLGAALGFVVLGNVAIANHAYDIGEHVPAASLSLLSLFVLWYDIPAIWNLIVKEKDTRFVHFYPTFNIKWQKYTAFAIKYSANLIFVVLFFFFEVYGFTHNDFYKIPNTTGLTGAKGFYNVTEFKLNGKVVPYSPTDTLRWHDATFEDWSSLSFKVVNRPDDIEMFAASSYPRRGEKYDNKWRLTLAGDERRFSRSEGGKEPAKKEPRIRDLNVGWELSGIGSNRKWYYYKADTVKQILYLQNKNRSNRKQKQELHYSRPTATRIILWGTNEFNQPIHVTLDKVQTQPLLLRDGRKPVPEWLKL